MRREWDWHDQVAWMIYVFSAGTMIGLLFFGAGHAARYNG